jgi:hypothetical protein
MPKKSCIRVWLFDTVVRTMCRKLTQICEKSVDHSETDHILLGKILNLTLTSDKSIF